MYCSLLHGKTISLAKDLATDISLTKYLGVGISFTVMELFNMGHPGGDYFLIETTPDIAYSIYFGLSDNISMSSPFSEI